MHHHGNVVLRKGSRLKRAIVDKHNIIGEGESFGFDPF
jgi:ADP-glucose pyrophosphorylase